MSDSYISPLSTRYASKQMQHLFSDMYKATTFRKLWTALAEAQHELGLDVTASQVEQLRANIDNIDLSVVASQEKIIRHDVMAHIYAYGQVAPGASPIIHMGATSCYVGDNTDLLAYYNGLLLIRDKLATVIAQLSAFATKYKDMPTLGMTHLQSAQPTTVGKRAVLWLSQFIEDYNDIQHIIDGYRLRGVKGTTGSQASFLQLFSGDASKVVALDNLVVSKLGFANKFEVTGQTYSRKFDYKLLAVLSSIAQSGSKFATDMRLLQSFGELEEPFESSQVGSSAMAYKRNPMRCERITALCRFAMSLPANASNTAGSQWLERTLDDSANKRLAVSEAFLTIDAVLNLLINVTNGIVVYDKIITNRLDSELPYMATEAIIMLCCDAGLSRQDAHEHIRTHSMSARLATKTEGKPNTLIDLIKNDEFFAPIVDKIDSIMDAKLFIGMCPEQVDNYISQCVAPILAVNAGYGEQVNIEV